MDRKRKDKALRALRFSEVNNLRKARELCKAEELSEFGVDKKLDYNKVMENRKKLSKPHVSLEKDSFSGEKGQRPSLDADSMNQTTVESSNFHLKNLRSSRIKPTGIPWEFDRPFPLTSGERRRISRKNYWFNLENTPPYGEYKVFPVRACLNWFSKQFWTWYAIRDFLSFLTDHSEVKPNIWALQQLRNVTLSTLGNNTKELTTFQRKTLNSIYFLMRIAKKSTTATD
jgi:hypothetical protein